MHPRHTAHFVWVHLTRRARPSTTLPMTAEKRRLGEGAGGLGCGVPVVVTAEALWKLPWDSWGCRRPPGPPWGSPLWSWHGLEALCFDTVRRPCSRGWTAVARLPGLPTPSGFMTPGLQGCSWGQRGRGGLVKGSAGQERAASEHARLALATSGPAGVQPYVRTLTGLGWGPPLRRVVAVTRVTC